MRFAGKNIAAIMTAVVVLLACWSGLRAEELIPVKLVNVMRVDDQGLPLRHPYYVFYDRYADEIYSISANGRITVFNSDYFPLVSIGRGRGIDNARGLDVDRDGNLYVCQNGGSKGPRITVLNAAYFHKKDILLGDLKGTGIDMRQFFRARRVRLAADGRMYVLGAATAVLVLKPDGSFDHWLRAWDELLRPTDQAVEGQPPGTLRPNPNADPGDKDAPPYGAVVISDINIDSEGRIYLVSNETSRVYVFSPREKFLFAFGQKGGAERKMSQPVGVAVDVPRQAIYVVDYMRHTVLVYDYYTGRYIFEFGGRGVAPLWFNFPNAITVDKKGNCIISDTFNQRLQVIDTQMNVRRPRLTRIEPERQAPPRPAPPAAVAGMGMPGRVAAAEPEEKIPARVAMPAVPAVSPGGGSVSPVAPLSLAAAARPAAPAGAGESAPRPGRVKAAAPVEIKPRSRKHAVPRAGKKLAAKRMKVAARRPAPTAGPARPSGPKVIDLPAALGVYGPVAVAGVIVAWFLLRR